MAQPELASHFIRQLEASDASEACSQQANFVFARSGIDARHFEKTPEEAVSRRDWYRLVNEATLSLSHRVIAKLGDDICDCDGFVVVSSSFAGFPSLSRMLQESCGVPLDAVCYDLAGLGCAGPTQGIHLAQLLLEEGHRQKVCLLCVDVMGTHGACRVHREAPTLSQVVAHCLASDGAAAMILSRDGGDGDLFSYQRCELTTALWPDALDQNDFTACSDNQPFISVGKAIRTRLLEEAGGILSEVADGPVFLHPGGAALMKSIASALPRWSHPLHSRARCCVPTATSALRACSG